MILKMYLLPLRFYISEVRMCLGIGRFIFLGDTCRCILQLMSFYTWRNMAIFSLHISEV